MTQIVRQSQADVGQDTRLMGLPIHGLAGTLAASVNIRNETEQCDGVTGDYMGRAIELFVATDKDKVIQKINRAMQSFSREEMPLFIYEVLEQSRLHAESQEAQRELWHGRKPN